MTSQEATTPTTAAGEEQKAAEEGRKDGGMQQRMSDAMQRMPLPGVRMPVAMPVGLPGRVLWWGGLAALAAFEVVDWPVAVIVGAGEWVAEQYAKAGAQNRHADQQREAPHSPSPANG